MGEKKQYISAKRLRNSLKENVEISVLQKSEQLREEKTKNIFEIRTFLT